MIKLHEDWTAVLLGFMLIFLALFGLQVPVPAFGWSGWAQLSETVFSGKNITAIGALFLLVAATAMVGAWLTGRSLRYFAIVFPLVFVLSMLALILAGNKTIKGLNLEAVIFSLTIGLLIGNLFRLPDWFKQALSTELYVKIGLVLLGTSIIFGDVLKAGAYGLVQSLIVVLSVWYFAFWVCKQFRIDEEMGFMISSAVSICGVSAAIATAGAIKGDTKKLSYVISMVLITAIPMMIAMPWLAKQMGLSQAVTGAWLGGSIDTTGAVVASGSLVGEEALKISTIVKFSQNVLLGLAAFAISVYWSLKGGQDRTMVDEKKGMALVWERFPKFVLGFLAASLLFSFFVSPDKLATVKDGLKNLQNLWFVLAFTSIGLETNFADLFHHDNRRPLYAFLLAQLFNIGITLLIAWLLFR
ncbi:MAG: YeiH family protein [Bacteroidetes bacterium]|nr:YeiH family protein [Bacteroidota bacterium]